MEYNKDLVSFVSATSENINAATAGKVRYAEAGDTKEIDSNGYVALSLTFKALDTIPAGQSEAVFSVSDAMVVPRGTITGSAANCGTDAKVVLTNYAVTLPANAKDVTGVDKNNQYLYGQDITFKLPDLN